MSRRLVWDWLLCAIVLLAAYAGRGWLLASLLQGRYPVTALLIDVSVLGVLIFVFRSLDLGLRVCFTRLLARRFASIDAAEGVSVPWRWRVLFDTLRFMIVFAVAAPFLVTLSQLHPQRIACAVTPADLGIPFEEVRITSTDGLTLAAWYLPGKEGSDRPAVLIAHGVGANKQNFLPVAQQIHDWGYPVLMLDFRAHGDSDGFLSTLGEREADDVKAALDWLTERHPDWPIIGVGYSMGAAAMVEASAREGRCDAYLLDSTFARLENSARHTMASYYIPAPLIGPWWHTTRLWGWTLCGVDLQSIRPEENIAALSDLPLLLVHGENDKTTSYLDSLRLQELTGNRAQVCVIEGAGHLQSVAHPDWYPRIQRFLDSVPQRRPSTD
jgi:pimeloyl-ACP methyl ester carboxylesterase